MNFTDESRISGVASKETSARRRYRAAASLFFGSRLSGTCLIVALMVLWEASVSLQLIQSANWPALTSVAVALYEQSLDGELPRAIGATLWVMARGYVLGCLSGIVIGFAIALNRPMRLTLEPTIDVLRTIPITAVIPPLIFIFGLGDALKLFSIAFAVVFPMALNVISGVVSIDTIYLQVAKTFGISRTMLVCRIIFPATLPFIMAGLRTSLGLALIVTVVAEMIAGNSGIGFYLIQMQFALRPAEMFAAVFVIAAVAYLLNRMVVMWESRVIHWARTREAIGAE